MRFKDFADYGKSYINQRNLNDDLEDKIPLNMVLRKSAKSQNLINQRNLNDDLEDKILLNMVLRKSAKSK